MFKIPFDVFRTSFEAQNNYNSLLADRIAGSVGTFDY